MTERPRAQAGARPVQHAEADDGPKHLIAEYRSASDSVTCTCGWQGASVGIHGGTSPWTAHVAQHRRRPPDRT